VDLRHSELPEIALAGHAYGWEHFVERLSRAACGVDLGPDEWMPLNSPL
jgi:hypothetical protein